jgi:hypothetical protein
MNNPQQYVITDGTGIRTLLWPHPGLVIPEQRPELIILQKASSPHALENTSLPPLLITLMDNV